VPRTISSAQTFLLKLVLPFIWIGGFSVGTALLFRAGDHLGERPPPPDLKWVFLAVLLLGSTFMYWWAIRLKRVVMTDGELRISNYRREIVVPLSEVDEVTENRWVNIHPVTVQFVRRTDFGHRIVFMPKARPFALFSSHPIVGELRAAAATAKAAPPGQTRQ
jgi:hypothetical protein